MEMTMKVNIMRTVAITICWLGLTCVVSGFQGFNSRPLPNPVLTLARVEPFTREGKQFIKYIYNVDNADSYPAEMFAASPDLPPCGKNTNASRTWIDFYDSRGKRLFGFCALAKPGDLNGIWFALEVDVVAPSYVYIEMNDRKTDTKYKSNLADTTL